MYRLNARDHFNCSPLLLSRPAPRNRCNQMERGPTCPGLHLTVGRPGFEPTTCWSQVQRPNYSFTEPHHEIQKSKLVGLEPVILVRLKISGYDEFIQISLVFNDDRKAYDDTSVGTRKTADQLRLGGS